MASIMSEPDASIKFVINEHVLYKDIATGKRLPGVISNMQVRPSDNKWIYLVMLRGGGYKVCGKEDILPDYAKDK